MKWTQTLALLFITIGTASSSVRGQDIGFYLHEMSTNPEVDSAFNFRIDSIWSSIDDGSIGSEDYDEVVTYLQEYYDRKSNVITADKAELYSYFILLKEKNYRSIIDRFEEKTGEYNHRAFTTISDIYRRSYLKHFDSDLTGYMNRLDSLSTVELSANFQQFIASVKDLQPGQKAPTFNVTDLEGQTYSLDSLRGKVVVLDFWATWCIPCIKEIPEIKRIYTKYIENEGFIIISISLDTDPEIWEKFVNGNGLDWPQVIESGRKEGSSRHSGTMATMYKAMGVPKYILIDKEGYVRYNSHLNNYKFVGEDIIDRYL
ncbi:thiol-disulfide isomerase/thioredoxin [Lewinella aquimaris]|uniref:Thiol-disulfide isomerase/thioredoxin n=1 Tax=Neolewinella aquimaris TaxID=1835722 RepID=A0A840EBN6_9BACT|nr:TlpA disulfide reductase family protein [Neolewinella aquimaris]MBB4081112.1 thiol-disulfide isomerase/thioredoxin [Neolewinella aquimaris]